MADLASTDELAARLGITLTASEKTRAATLLGLASDLIREEAGQTIEQVEDEKLTRPGQEDRRLRLPQRPVVSVSSVVLEGVAIDSSTYHLEGDTLVRDQVLVNGRDYGDAGGWGHPHETLEIVYTHGYAADSIPGTVRTVCLEVAVRAFTNPGSVSQEIHGSEQTSYGDYRSRVGMLLTDIEKKSIARALAPRARTLSLR